MNSLTEFLRERTDLLVGKPVKETEIIDIQEKLNILFADEYKSILRGYGYVCVDGHEITGITNAKRLNVYDVTIKERANISYDLSELYVIEQTHIDGIVIWQSESGEVYQTVADSKPEKIADSIVEYLNS